MNNSVEFERLKTGVDPKSVVREALIEMRDRLFRSWPDTIDDTLIVTHAVWWLAQDLQGQSRRHTTKFLCMTLVDYLEQMQRLLEHHKDAESERVAAAIAALQSLVEVL